MQPASEAEGLCTHNSRILMHPKNTCLAYVCLWKHTLMQQFCVALVYMYIVVVYNYIIHVHNHIYYFCSESCMVVGWSSTSHDHDLLLGRSGRKLLSANLWKRQPFSAQGSLKIRCILNKPSPTPQIPSGFPWEKKGILSWLVDFEGEPSPKNKLKKGYHWLQLGPYWWFGLQLGA